MSFYTCRYVKDYFIDVPNVRNIAIVQAEECTVDKLHVSSLNAVTCQILKADVADLTFNLPQCPAVLYGIELIIKCDTDILRNHRERIDEWQVVFYKN
jgi:hypothetical protein